MRLLFLSIIIFSSMAHAQDLEQYRWKNRVVVLFSDGSKNTLLSQQQKRFDGELAAMQERDMVVLVGEKSLKQQLNLENDFQGVVLIGKDGGIKFSDSFLVKPETLFALIDAMPMRKAEMRQNKG